MRFGTSQGVHPAGPHRCRLGPPRIRTGSLPCHPVSPRQNIRNVVEVDS
jgi:hypothetical protein